MPAAGGTYTFDILSDDSNQFPYLRRRRHYPRRQRLYRRGRQCEPLSDKSGFTDDGACCTDTLGVATLAAGSYTLEGVFNQQGGGASFGIYGATGTFSAYSDSQFQLLGTDAGPTATFVPARVTGTVVTRCG